jgi:hypothetical protein
MTFAELVKDIAARAAADKVPVRVIYDGERFGTETVTQTHARIVETGKDRLEFAGSKSIDQRPMFAAERQMLIAVHAQDTRAGALVSDHRERARSIAYSLAVVALEALHAGRCRWLSAEGELLATDDAQPTSATYALTITYSSGISRSVFELADSPVAGVATNVTVGLVTEANC